MIETPKTDLYFDIDERKKAEGLDRYFISGEKESIISIPNFNQINIFVGANNSGKSMFMRELMKMRASKSIDSLNLIEGLVLILNKLILKLNINWVSNRRMPRIPLNHELEIINDNESIVLDVLNYQKRKLNLFIEELKERIKVYEKIKFLYDKNGDRYYEDGNLRKRVAIFSPEIYNKIDSLFNHLLNIVRNQKERLNKEIIYIPTLRTAHSLFQVQNNETEYKKVTEDIFLETYIRNYGIQDVIINRNETNNENDKYLDVFTGLDLYNQILIARNGSKEQRQKFEAFEQFVGENFFGGSIDIVAQFDIYEKVKNKDENEITQVQIKGRPEQRLFELGDGIQAIIILLFKVFMAKKDAVIFIDEPELNLHPGMQRLFLEQITNNKELTDKNLTYIIATHSNHLLDLTLQHDSVSIYSFNSKSDEKFEIRNVNLGDNRLLRNLGVNNSSVFLANKTIWVEGVSDRNYIKAFLIAYYKNIGKPEPKEDLDFAFF